ncbi:GbsR/MarR family transcriptional regulator [Amycolatopsis taiwanensis]|uniref:GbsR/MarR family transcriptional regulator n=1 Tax=Amycolatopsis taiwanensis TaxID=342230 RepID=UPI0004897D55|nr:MarR family transcriptional regulator [Amycolatopsis taiwanensis]
MSSRPQSQRDPATDDAVLHFVEKFALLLTDAGMPRMPARVFSLLLTVDGAGLTAAGVAEALNISPAAVSGAVKYLMQVSMVQRGRRPGERRDHYFIGDDAWYHTLGDRDKMFQTLCDTLDEGVQAVGPDTVRGRRLAETRDFFSFLAVEMSRLVERWLQQREAES